jgi:hypothetical protein
MLQTRPLAARSSPTLSQVSTFDTSPQVTQCLRKGPVLIARSDMMTLHPEVV